ncbi:MAG: hypothetical protein AB1529_00730 [Candidatus Micrarchaeota archaeon]
MRDGWKTEGPALDELVLGTKDGRKGKRALAIVITSFQARESLAEHLRRLSRQSRKDFDIIAVYGEKDEFLETPGWAGVLHVREKGRMGCAGANYIGQKIALQEGYESVILADDDCMPVSDDLVEKLAGSPGDCAMPNAGYGRQEAVPGFIIHHYGILRRGVLEKAGLTYLPFGNGGEDLELIDRIRKAGMNFSQADARVSHPAPAPMMLEGGGRLFHYQRGLLLYRLICRMRVSALRYIAYSLLSGLLMACAGDRGRGVLVFRALWAGSGMRMFREEVSGPEKASPLPAEDGYERVEPEGGDAVAAIRMLPSLPGLFGKRILLCRTSRPHAVRDLAPLLMARGSAIEHDGKAYAFGKERGLAHIAAGIILALFLVPLILPAALMLWARGIVCRELSGIDTAGYGVRGR